MVICDIIYIIFGRRNTLTMSTSICYCHLISDINPNFSTTFSFVSVTTGHWVGPVITGRRAGNLKQC